ncbi:MAG TPA: pitrilysin family protein [Polyangiaceae bacterium]|jgi:zinc protease
MRAWPLLFLLSAAAAEAAPPPKAPPVASPAKKGGADDLPRLNLDVRKATLPNGLRIVLSVDHTSPTVAVDVLYDVGSRNEERGHSGFAHLFEHLMFQGSANVPRGEHIKLVSAHGGTLNADTTVDRTNYFDLLPASELPLGLWLEGDRMKSLDVSAANLDNQRQVVQEEYRMRILNAAYVPASFRLDELVFQGYWPYEHHVIGTMEDLNAAQLEWVRQFHRAFYAPNEAVLAVAGDFDPDLALDRIKTYFGDAPAAPSPPKFEAAPLPEQTAPREAVVEDAHARFPAVFYGWPIPPRRSPDHYALEIAGDILAGGESARLYKSLVHDRATAIEVSAGADGKRGPDEFSVVAKVSTKGTVAGVEKDLLAALAALAKTPPSDAEMTKVRHQRASSFLFGLASNYARAEQLATFEMLWGDAALLNGELDQYLAVTKEDVSRVVAKYLVPNHTSRVEVKPAASDETKPAAAKGGKP